MNDEKLVTAEQLQSVLAVALADYDLSGAQLHAMSVLASARSGLPLGMVARAMGCTSANATGIADMLARMGMAERKHGFGDRRVVRLALTEKGRDAMDAILSGKRQLG